MKPSQSILVGTLLLCCSIPLFACDYSFYPYKPHSLVDTHVIQEPKVSKKHGKGADPDEDGYDDSVKEWRDYFAERRKQKFTLPEVDRMIEAKNTPFDDVNAYLEMVEKTARSGEEPGYPVNLEAVQMASNKKLDGFLRARYAYHAVASAVLAEKWEQGIGYYDKLFLPLGVRSSIYYQAMGWKARALVRVNKTEQAVALYAEMYDQSLGMSGVASQSLRMIGAADDLGALAKDLPPGHRRTTAFYLQHTVGGRDYSASTLSKVTEDGPREAQVEKILVAMMREVEEDYFENECPHFFGQPDFVAPKNAVLKFLSDPLHKKPAFADLIPVCEKAAEEPKIRRSAIWSWGASYLALLAGDLPTARRDIDKAAKSGADDDSMTAALHLQETLVEMAEHPKDFPSDLQKRLTVDIAQYGPPKTDPAKAAVTNSWERILGPHENGLIVSTLWALAIQKYIYMGDWAHACLLASAVAAPSDRSYEDSQIDLTLFLDFSTSEELAQLKVLLKHGFFSKTSPLEALALKKTSLRPKDMDLLIALRKANRFDFAGAVSDLEKDMKKDSDFLGTATGPVTSEYGERSMGTFYNGSCISPKRVLFGYDYKKITMDIRSGDMDLLSYLKLMKSLFADLEKGKKGNKALEAQAAFDIGRILATEDMTGWPEFRTEESCCYGKSAIHTESCPLYFLGAILGKERQKRFNQFEEDTPRFTKVASGYFREAADASPDPELKAQSLAFLMGLNYDQSIARTLREKYSATAFYQRYKTVCSWLGEGSVTPGPRLPVKRQHRQKATLFMSTPLATPSPTAGK